MKKLFIIFILFSLYSIGQVPPEAFNYSAVLRGNNGQALPNHIVSLRFSILKGSSNGPIQYQEIHIGSTNQWGSINLSIGYGQLTQGNFSSINWGDDSYYLQIELDDNGGNNFNLMGSQKFLSVPYALYAGHTSNISYLDTSSINELQSLTLSNDTIYLSHSGGNIVLPHIPANISELNNDVGYLTYVYDGDTSSTNELQFLSISHDTIYLTNGGFVKLPPAYAGTNTDNQQLSITHDTISLTNGGQIIIPVPCKHYVGEHFGGGIVFHVFKDENYVEHGLIVSLIDISTGARWGSASVNILNSESTWDGLTNTNSIINSGGSTSDAAGLCHSYNGEGYTDWYLPSIDQLNILLYNRFNVNKSLSSIGATVLGFNTYWSSTEQSTTYAYYCQFYNGLFFYNNKNDNLLFVRAIRSF